MSNHWETVIGLEVHVQLKTASKLFAPDSTAFGRGDNENISPITLGLPGVLPVLNKDVKYLSTRLALGLNAHIHPRSEFARKNYFYPDMPKGYQISQLATPFCVNGKVTFYLDDKKQEVRIQKAHIEEDAGKLTHHGEYSLVNYNRAGIPLMEVVTEPDMQTGAQAAEFARTLRRIVRYLDVCEGNLEEGSMRCDCNVSIRPKGQKELGTKVEIKNINSFRFIEKAIEHEVQRQIDVIETGGKIVQETRLYDAVKNRTFSMRKKEAENDYRYFPEPDLPMLDVSQEWIDDVKSKLPELPVAKAERFMQTFELPGQDAWSLVDEKEIADYFELACASKAQPKLIANWVLQDVKSRLNEENLDISKAKISAKDLGELVLKLQGGSISIKIAKDVFKKMWDEKKSFAEIQKTMDLSQVTDTGEIEKLIEGIIKDFPAQVEELKSGKQKVMAFFVGEAMKRSKGKANPGIVNQILKAKVGVQ